MPPDTMDVLTSALSLPVNERARIAHELIASLDSGSDEGAAQAWVAELELRANEGKTDPSSSEPWDALRKRLAERWARR